MKLLTPTTKRHYRQPQRPHRPLRVWPVVLACWQEAWRCSAIAGVEQPEYDGRIGTLTKPYLYWR